jgi:SAM-dependent methyltransferase
MTEQAQAEDTVDDLQLLLDLHRDGSRQGPGGDAETEKALDLAGLDRSRPLKIADIGCGSGASTLQLARLLNAQIVAVDFLQDFLDVLVSEAKKAGLAGQITPMCRSMDALPFDDEDFDVIWSEGAIYNIGFEKGVSDWRRYLKAGGLLVASEITWLTDSRPAELDQHWNAEYPEVACASVKMQVLEQQGYAPIGYVVLPESCWMENYYRPMMARFPAFLDRHGNSEAARAIVEAEQREIALYEQYKAFYSYGVYIARKLD